MPATQEQVATPREIVINLTEDVALRHEANNTANVKNNRGFALLDGVVVEVVRRGSKATRIRRNLDQNDATELVATAQLAGYTHPSLAE